MESNLFLSIIRVDEGNPGRRTMPGNMNEEGGKMKFTVMMEFNENLLPALYKTPQEFAAEIRLFAAAKWYELGRVSQERAAEIAGMNRSDFMLAISRLGVSPFQYDYKEVLGEVENVG